PATRAPPVLPLHRARSRRSGAYLPQGRRDVSRQDRRAHRQALAVCTPAAPVYRSAAVRGASTGSARPAQAHHPLGGSAQPGRAPGGLPLPHALPLRPGTLPRRGTGDEGSARGPLGGMPPAIESVTRERCNVSTRKSCRRYLIILLGALAGPSEFFRI